MIKHNGNGSTHRVELGRVSAKMGTFAEDFVAPDMGNILGTLIPIPSEVKPLVNVRIYRRHPETNLIIEFDAVADYGDVVLVNETKNTLRPKDIPHFIKTKLTPFRLYFPEYAHHRLYGLFAICG